MGSHRHKARGTAVVWPGYAPPSRSEGRAEARPPATAEVEPVGSISDGMQAVRPELRPCCPDAGDERCHGQMPGACGCYACRRAERRALRNDVGAVREGLQRAALPLGTKKHVRRMLARVLLTLRGRVRAAERRKEQVEWRHAALMAGQAADLSRLIAELVHTQNRRDDALMQASAAAERAHQVEREYGRLSEQHRADEERLCGLQRELEALRGLGRVVAPSDAADPEPLRRLGRALRPAPASELDGLEDES